MTQITVTLEKDQLEYIQKNNLDLNTLVNEWIKERREKMKAAEIDELKMLMKKYPEIVKEVNNNAIVM